jgi:hypothetical protein
VSVLYGAKTLKPTPESGGMEGQTIKGGQLTARRVRSKLAKSRR